MRMILAAVTAVPLLLACQPDSDKTNPAIATNESREETTAAAPAAGASSFTMDQARDRITAAGYSDVSGLAQDANGVWRGTAMKSGASTPVMVDYQGNVTAQ
jgi:hypothetical protein